MKMRRFPLSAAWLLASLCAAHAEDVPTNVAWKKTVIDKQFRSEGVAVGDVNKDGKMDILVGDLWYEAPSWEAHEIRKPGNYGDGSGGYSQCFACWADDINGDGWVDLVLVGFPGAPCYWYENPQNKEGHWKQYEICNSACNETPQYVDLTGKGKRGLVMGYQEKQMIYAVPTADPTKPWDLQPISEPGKPAPGTGRFAHGLGVTDVNGDGKLDVVCTGGWWEQPAAHDGKTAWKFHGATISPNCADMYAIDVDGDGKADIVSSSAHNFGIWAHLQQSDDKGPKWQKQDLFPKLFSQSHAMNHIDINGDGAKDLVTGKRRWAHGPRGDDEPMAPPVLYWFETKKGSDNKITFVPHPIDDSSGIGTQFWTGDFNGDKLPDVVISNKMGVFLIEQVRAAASGSK